MRIISISICVLCIILFVYGFLILKNFNKTCVHMYIVSDVHGRSQSFFIDHLATISLANITILQYYNVRRGGLVVRASGSQAKHDGFESWSRHVISLSKEFTHIAQANSAFYQLDGK